MTLTSTFIAVLLSLTLTTTFASPIQEPRDLERRGAILTGMYSSERVSERYMLKNNLWGQSSATSGSQSSQATGMEGQKVSWTTTYNWNGNPHTVKSYADIDLMVGINKRLSAIKSIPTSWSWSYSSASPNLIADVAYDLWLSPTSGTQGASSATSYEIMIWLSTRGGARPAGSQVATVNIGGVNWGLYRGTVKSWTVYSFVAPKEIQNYNTDLKLFFNYLISNQNVPASNYLVQAQAGTEPFVGSAKLTTQGYSISVH